MDELLAQPKNLYGSGVGFPDLARGQDFEFVDGHLDTSDGLTTGFVQERRITFL